MFQKKQKGYILLTLLFTLVSAGALFFVSEVDSPTAKRTTNNIIKLNKLKKDVRLYLTVNEGKLPAETVSNSLPSHFGFADSMRKDSKGNYYRYEPLISIVDTIVKPDGVNDDDIVMKVIDTAGKDYDLLDAQEKNQLTQTDITKAEWFESVSAKAGVFYTNCINQFRTCDYQIAEELKPSPSFDLESDCATPSVSACRYYDRANRISTPSLNAFTSTTLLNEVNFSYPSTFEMPEICALPSTAPVDNYCHNNFYNNYPANPLDTSLLSTPLDNYALLDTASEFLQKWNEFVEVFSLPSNTPDLIYKIGYDDCRNSNTLVKITSTTPSIAPQLIDELFISTPSQRAYYYRLNDNSKDCT